MLNSPVWIGLATEHLNSDQASTLLHLSNITEDIKMPKLIDITNHRFGRLTVLTLDRSRKGSYWNCSCSCGNNVAIMSTNLRRGVTKSCGCLNAETRSSRRVTHGMTGTPEYNTWHLMKRRCYNKTDKHFSCYGGRGITVCERWLGKKGSTNFFSDMGRKPSPNHSLDRIDNDSGYAPDNCRWATLIEQANNTRRNLSLEINGVKKTAHQWADQYGIAYSTFISRMGNKGWSPERALNTPVRK